jgi:hypothetical protein
VFLDQSVDPDVRLTVGTPSGTPAGVLAFSVLDGRITEIRAVIDPATLAHADLPDPA